MSKPYSRPWPLIPAVCFAAALGGCVTLPGAGGGNPDEGIGYRQARFQQVQQVRDYRTCRDHGVELDTKARSSGEPSGYLAAARMLEGCETDLGSAASTLAVEERMRALALAVQGRMKGGDLRGARAALDRMQDGFKDRDLYFDDGTSFIESMDALLVAGGDGGRVAPSTANVPTTLKEELRRIAEWRRR